MEGCRPASRGCALELMTYVNARTRPSAASTDVRPEVRIVRSPVGSRMASAARKSRRLAVGMPVGPRAAGGASDTGQGAVGCERVNAPARRDADSEVSSRPAVTIGPVSRRGSAKTAGTPLALRGGDPKQTSERQRPRREEGLFAAARQELAPGRRICGLDDARPHDPAEVERTTFGRHDKECTRAQDRLVRLVARGC